MENELKNRNENEIDASIGIRCMLVLCAVKTNRILNEKIKQKTQKKSKIKMKMNSFHYDKTRDGSLFREGRLNP